MNPAVSVVIPVYNAERALARCIRSLLDQTLPNIELIFVDDGSTDGSCSVIEKFRYYDERIRLFRQRNGGVSEARNTGLQHARGEYIGFVDADDYVEKDMFQRLLEAAKRDDCDAVVSNLEQELDGVRSAVRPPMPCGRRLEAGYIRSELLPLYVMTESMNTVCNKLYRGELVRRHGIRFPKGVALGEDGAFNISFFAAAASVQYIDYTGYHYCETANSATRSAASRDYFARAVEVYEAELPEPLRGLLDRQTEMRLKAVKLVQSVMANAHIYLHPSSERPARERLDYVRHMIAHRAVREALPLYMEARRQELNRYDKLLLQMIEARSAWGLWMLTGYSRFRNRRKQGKSA